MCSLQLGEQAEWDKYTSYQVSHRAPVMLHVPGLVDQATFSAELVEFVDIFPSLVEAAGLPPLHKCPVNSRNVSLCREGRSLLGLVDGESPSYLSYLLPAQETRCGRRLCSGSSLEDTGETK